MLYRKKGYNMTNKKEKKKTSPVFLGVVVAVMAAVFAAQMLFPTNLGKLFDKQAENAVEISVTVTRDGAAGASYHTASEDHIDAFGKWAAEQTMRNRSVADSLTPDANRIMKYNFAIKKSDGTFADLIIDEKGFVHAGAELYMISGSVESFLKELDAQMEGWKEA